MILIYLASPYSHPDPIAMEQRFSLVCQKTIQLMNWGYLVFSPIVNGHSLVGGWGIPGTYDYWQHLNRRMIEVSDEFHVYCLPGWRESVGVTAEINFAKQICKPIIYHQP